MRQLTFVPISRELRRLGAAEGGHLDEFDAVGLGLHRGLGRWPNRIGEPSLRGLGSVGPVALDECGGGVQSVVRVVEDRGEELEDVRDPGPDL